MSLSSHFSSFFSRFQIRRFVYSNINNRSLPLIPKLSRLQKSIFVVSCLFIFALITVHGSPITTKTLATTQEMLEQKENAINTGGNLEAWGFENFGGALTTVKIFVGGTTPPSCFQFLRPFCYAPGSGQTLGGAIGNTNQLIAAAFSPPASGIEYLAQIKDSFLGKPALAQGIGFAGLQPLLPIWRGFRNIVYILSSIIFIAIGVMIILRVKISPQAVVTIQNAIPSLITTLILVTFSYAIAGLIIDLSSLIQALVLAMLYQVQGRSLTQNIVGTATQIPLLGADFSFSSLSNPSLSSVYFLTKYMLPANTIALLGAIGGAIVGTLFGPGWGTVIGGGAGLLLMLVIVTILLLVWQLKFFFGILKTYVTIIFKIVIAPLEIAMGAFPGSKMGFSSWINDLVAYMAVFPVSIIFLVLANIIIERTGVSIWQNNPAVGGGLWTPSLLNGGGLPGVLAAASGGLVPAGIGLVAAGIMSKLPDMVPQFIFSLKPSPWTQAAEATYKSNVVDKAKGFGNVAINTYGPGFIDQTAQKATGGTGIFGAQVGGQKIVDITLGGKTIGTRVSEGLRSYSKQRFRQ